MIASAVKGGGDQMLSNCQNFSRIGLIFLPDNKISCLMYCRNSVVEQHHFYVAPAPGKNFDAATAAPAAPAPILLHSKAKFLKLTKV
jgi:hypothetical protein